jgi:CubicO group peptidase (beta-lactamase class C family)
LVFAFLLVKFVSVIYQTKEVKKNSSLEIFTAHLEERIPALMETYDIPGVSIAIVEEGKTTWTKAYGYADLKSGRKMTTDTYLRVQSISKSVTAWGVMKLVEEGKIDLEMPVSRYLRKWNLPESDFSEEKVTIRQLLSHTAGMPLGDFFNFYSPQEKGIPSLEESLSKEAVLFQEPGSSFFYSNTGFNFLELLIEEVTGRDFSEYMEQEILTPLGMFQSSFVWRETFDPEIPIGYGLTGNAVPVYVYPEKGSGGLFASVGDIATFVSASMPAFFSGQQVLKPSTINQLQTPKVEGLGMYSLVFDSYGFGHYIDELPDGKQAISHGGQGTGWMTQFYAVPETGDGIVILTNSQRSWPFIAYILTDWGEWRGLSSIGMSRILLGIKMMWFIIGLIWAGVLWQTWSVVEELMNKNRDFSPLSNVSRPLRLTQAVVCVVILAGLIWSLNQDYLFISSIFPITSVWLGFSGFMVALVLLVSVLFPKKSSIE